MANSDPFKNTWSDQANQAFIDANNPDKSKNFKTNGDTNSSSGKSEHLNSNGALVASGVVNPTKDANAQSADEDASAIPGKLTPSSNLINDGSVTRQYQKFIATFHTQDGEINASFSLGRPDVDFNRQRTYEGYLNDEIIGFTTKNDNQNDIPTMTIRLTGLKNWESLLEANDYVELNVVSRNSNTNEQQADTLMTGVISDVTRTMNAQSNNINYLVTCQGVAKILANVTLTTFTELASVGGTLLQDATVAGDADDTDSTSDTDKDDEDKGDD